MKKLLIAGCSHSVGLGLDKNQPTWYELFALDYKYSITNVALAGSSIQYAIHSIIDAIYKNDFDLIFFQLTTLNRYWIPTDGEKPFLTDDITNHNDSAPIANHLTQAEYLSAVDEKSKLEAAVSREIFKYFYEKVIYSTVHNKVIANELYLLQQLCTHRNIPLVLIPYDDWHWGDISMLSFWKIPESNKIDKRYYIDEPFMSWLRENSNPDDYYLDNGFHLNAEGQYLFVNEYFIPKFKKFNINNISPLI